HRQQRTDVDQGIGGGLTWLLNAHALFDQSLHTQHPDAKLSLEQLAHAAYTTVAKMVDIVIAPMSIVEINHTAHNIDQIILSNDTLGLRHAEIELAIELVASDAAHVVAARIKEEITYQRAGILQRCWIA